VRGSTTRVTARRRNPNRARARRGPAPRWWPFRCSFASRPYAPACPWGCPFSDTSMVCGVRFFQETAARLRTLPALSRTDARITTMSESDSVEGVRVSIPIDAADPESSPENGPAPDTTKANAIGPMIPTAARKRSLITRDSVMMTVRGQKCLSDKRGPQSAHRRVARERGSRYGARTVTIPESRIWRPRVSTTIVDTPALRPLTTPSASTVATSGDREIHR
jgi:hypothetical protein